MPMLFDGQSMQLEKKQDGFFHLRLNNISQSVNTLSYAALAELAAALTLIEKEIDQKTGKGLLISSDKAAFVLGADITEFIPMFSQGSEVLMASLMQTHAIFNRLEDLNMPTVAALNGHCLGGGTELALCCDYRIAASDLKMGLPEVKLGIFPGFGGSVRLPRLIGADMAFEWICLGAEHTAKQAQADGVVDAVLEGSHFHEQLVDKGFELLAAVTAGKLPYETRRLLKKSAIQLNQIESIMSFETAKAFVGAKAGRHYPAPVVAVKTVQKHAWCIRAQAQQIETRAFAEIAQGDVARHLIGLFINDQTVKKISKHYLKKVDQNQRVEIQRAAVLGAGIMGGGIAYQSASKGLTIHMKDINDAGLDLGLKEAAKLFGKQVKRGKIDVTQMAVGLNNIRPCLTYGELAAADVVVEAVVEHPKVKQQVLAEAENALTEDTVLCSNTSTISINQLASVLKKPENFCGMHFFNPVHRMPLVEVIRGKETSDLTIAKVVNYALKLGKTPIVVNDCPGFLVNRILFPYFTAFAQLVADGVDYQLIDKTMEKFGWPMGPAQLLDVVGLDTGEHAQHVMAQGFPERMAVAENSAISTMFQKQWFGQKNGLGFYQWSLDKKGKAVKALHQEAMDLLYVNPVSTMDEENIISRMMLPMCFEMARCLEEKIVASPSEADMAVIYGIGFPPFRGGVVKYMDDIGAKNLIKQAEEWSELGALYQVPDIIKTLEKSNTSFYELQVTLLKAGEKS